MDKIIVEYQLKTEALRKELGDVKGKLSDAEKQIETSGNKMSNVFKNVGKAIGAAFSVQMLIQFAKKSLEVYDIQAKAEASLLQALKGREDVQKRLMLQASELQKVTLFGDEATIQAQAMLAKFGMTETQIKRLIPLIQDYATISGQDLTSAADMVARSVATSTNALVRYGVEIEGAAGSSERMESAVDALSNMVGGQAVAAAQAGTGAVTQFNNAWGDFAESVGEDILPALTRLTNAATDLLYVVDSVPEGTPGFFEKLFTGGTVGILEYARALGKVREQMESGGLVTDEEVFNRAQEDFAQWRKEWKDTYATLEEAGDAYIENLSAKIRESNGLLAESSEEEKKAIYEANKQRTIQIEAVQLYVEEMTKTVKVTGDASKETKKLTADATIFKEVIEKIPVLVKDMVTELDRLRAAAQDTDLSGFYGSLDEQQGFLDIQNELIFSGQQLNPVVIGLTSAYQSGVITLEQYSDLLKQIKEDQDAARESAALSSEQSINDIFVLGDAIAGTFGAISFAYAQLGKENEKLLGFSKQAAFAEIILSQGVAIAKALQVASTSATNPLTFFTSLATILTAIFATIGQATSIASSAKIPKYATGVVDLKGAGTETSDSITARLSKGESVITAKGTRQDKGLFQAANKLRLEEYINKNYVLPVLLKKQQEDKAMFDDYRLYLALKDGQRQDRELNKAMIKAVTQRHNRYNNWN
jgi:hypothetical protein